VKLTNHLVRVGWSVTVVSGRHEGATDPLLSSLADVHAVTALEPRLLLAAVAGLDRAVARTTRAMRLTAPGVLDPQFAIPEDELGVSRIGWVVPAVRLISRLARERPVNVIIATMPPAAAGVAASIAGKLLGVPVLLDYRDPWNAAPVVAYDETLARRRDPLIAMRLALSRLVESLMLRAASAVVIVNGRREIDRLRAQFTQATRLPVHWIPNGIDLDDIRRTAPPPRRRDRARVVHIGHFYSYRTPYYFLQGLRALVHSAHPPLPFFVEFVGSGFPDALRNTLPRWGIDGLVQVTNTVSYPASLAAASDADIGLVLLPPLEPLTECIPTKLYEYIGCGCPVLAVVPEGAAAELVRTTGCGLVADPADPASIATALAELLERPAHTNRVDAERFAWNRRAAEFERVLEDLVARHRTGSRRLPFAPTRSAGFQPGSQ
jgi:glycosyltransferase involved in cell wall biosynthesis